MAKISEIYTLHTYNIFELSDKLELITLDYYWSLNIGYGLVYQFT